MKKFFLLIFLLFIPLSGYNLKAQAGNKVFLAGADVLLKEKINSLHNKNIAIITNQTSLLMNGTHIVDSLITIKNINIRFLYSPEHGIRGTEAAGASVSNSIDTKTGLKVISLYGGSFKPTNEDLKGIDFLLFDLQDVGARYYTYISTLYYAMEASAQNNITFVVLDRPNPVSPVKPDGPITDKKYISFVSIAPIPIIYGMTTGELAQLFNYLLKKEKGISCNLEIIKMQNWNRAKFLNKFYSNWISPSPNITSLEAALIYPGTCLIEGTNVSEGRGTDAPFLTIGAPFIDNKLLIQELEKLGIPGVTLTPINFVPVDIPGKAINPKYKGRSCNGIKIKINDYYRFEPLKFGIKLIYALHNLFPGFRFKESSIDNLFGNSYLREMINKGLTPDKIIAKWQKELNNFVNFRKKFLLY